MRRRAVLLGVTSALAGCSVPLGGDAGDSGDADSSGAGGGDGTATSGQSSQAANPWGKATLSVGLVDETGPWRDVTPLLEAALAFWNENAAQYGRYDASFDLVGSADEPDVLVRYVEDVADCGSSGLDGGVGFAPRITDANPPEPPEYICVAAGLSDRGTQHVIEHEFGHLLGLTHGDRPTDLMHTDIDYIPIPRPGPDVLAAEFPTDPLSVFVDRSAIVAQRDLAAQRQLEATFAYLEDGADGTLDDSITIRQVDDPAAADVSMSFPWDAECERIRAGSCGTLATRPDGGDRLDVEVITTHEYNFGWQAGLWLAIALGVDRHRDLPAPFRNATFEERRGGWWDESG